MFFCIGINFDVLYDNSEENLAEVVFVIVCRQFDFPFCEGGTVCIFSAFRGIAYGRTGGEEKRCAGKEVEEKDFSFHICAF